MFTKNAKYFTDGKRMVNQPEIVAFLERFPGQTEAQIYFKLYGFDRDTSFFSNKKYADCLRRALDSGKINRVKARIKTPEKQGKYYIYFAS